MQYFKMYCQKNRRLSCGIQSFPRKFVPKFDLLFSSMTGGSGNETGVGMSATCVEDKGVNTEKRRAMGRFTRVHSKYKINGSKNAAQIDRRRNCKGKMSSNGQLIAVYTAKNLNSKARLIVFISH